MYNEVLLKGDTFMAEENEQHFGKIRGIVDKLFKKEEMDAEEELLNIVQEAEEEGEFNEQEGEIIRNAISFNNLEAVDILTPRVDLIAIRKNESDEEIQEKIFESGFSNTTIRNPDVPAEKLPVPGATLFVATIPVPTSPSGAQNGTPA